jgi:ribose 5-phosphate isomerase A
MNMNLENEKQLAAREAIKYVLPGQVIGLGTGSTANYAIREIASMVQNGLNIKAVSSSEKTTKMALELGIPIVDINSVSSIDVTIDGADEFTPEMILIKGGGGALLREKIVASMSRQEIIIADSSKKTDLLGSFKVPIEIIPFATGYVIAELKKMSGVATIRLVNNIPFVTDQGNHILDVDFGKIKDPISLAEKLNSIVGIVCHGLFINLAHIIIMGSEDRTVVFSK